MMNKEKPAVNTQHIIYAALVVILVGALTFILPGQSPGNGQMAIEQQVVQELSSYEEIKPFAGYPVTAMLLSEERLAPLRNQQPAIYSDVPVNSYEVDYDGKSIGKENGLLVIYDYNNKEILKMFAVQDFTI